jgi:hypothetical protein
VRSRSERRLCGLVVHVFPVLCALFAGRLKGGGNRSPFPPSLPPSHLSALCRVVCLHLYLVFLLSPYLSLTVLASGDHLRIQQEFLDRKM